MDSVTDLSNSADSPTAVERAELNGKPVHANDLCALALQNYGHFSTLRVVKGRVRGLDLHFARLDAATREMFGCTLDEERARSYLRRIVGDSDETLSIRITVFSREFRRDRPERPSAVDVLATRSPARAPDLTPIRLKSFAHERVLPHVKHVGTFGLFHYRRLARVAGFDDALFIASSGAVSEASVWNIGFFDGTTITWPNAPALAGISMQLLQNGLRARGIASESRCVMRTELGSYRSAFVTNALCPVRAVAAIDDIELIVDRDLLALLDACYEASPWQRI
jgi:branched-subunit amino acid aminotransferase/4-amino-4-deoxychorismate lyase